MSSNKAKPIKFVQILVMVEKKSQLIKKKQNQKLYKRNNKLLSPSSYRNDINLGPEKKNIGKTLPENKIKGFFIDGRINCYIINYKT